ncbi:MAG: translation initiation factor IF-2, partial [Candidatus Omnitrophota bacterium]|nr:translation initiation factor IF-2 [Candidatus Omnitrophota bacterium]
ETKPREHQELRKPQAQEPQVKEGIPAGEAAPEVKKIAIDIPITVKNFAVRLGLKTSALITTMMGKGIFATINQPLNEEIVNEIARIYGIKIEKLPTLEEKALKDVEKGEEKDFLPRPPVVTFMGHVDHGKTSLLDMIRKTKITAKEYGGITQHIGAYEVMLKNGAVTFLDTPGHRAFTEMRARGANATDVVILVVAADDGIKPQTLEAIDHARAAGVPIVVALNKCDLPNINADKVRTQLSQIGLMAEDWGGETITVQVSAKTGEGIDKLLEMLLLEAELLELKANPKVPARGVVIESELSRGRGVVAAVLVKNGTLRAGDVVIAGSYFGKIKAMANDRGQRVQEALPSMPVEILGLSGVPRAGEKFFVVDDEKKVRDYCLQRQAAEKEKELAFSKRVSLEGLYQQIEKGRIKELKVIIKGDVSGSIEALHKTLSELSTKDIKINVIHSGVGDVNDSDVVLALASDAIIIGFHVRIEPKAQATAESEGVQIKLYNVIYEAASDIDAAMEGMLEPIMKETFLGRAQVRKTFMMSRIGTIAGCYVVKGRIPRNAIVKLLRVGKIIYEGKMASLKRFKDDIKEAAEGYECGIVLVNHNNVKEGDTIEAFEIQKIARRLR